VTALHIRKATSGDADLVIRFIHALAVYEKLPGPDAAGEKRIRTYGWSDQPRFEVLLAYEDETPVGFALYFYQFSTFAARPTLYLEDLFVYPEYRGRGYGKRLLVDLAREARESGCGRMDWMVLDWNESAIDFYRALGALVLDDWRLCRLEGEALQSLGLVPEQASR
jgi:GNAT superfamily N-acetyltransferase